MANNSGPFYDVGVHVGQISKHGLTKASTGNKQFVMTVKVLGIPETDGSYTPHQQQYERTIYWTITEKTIPFIVEKLQRLNYTGTAFSQLDPSSTNHVSMVGEQIDLWCSHEPSASGVGMREKWDISNGGGKELEPLTAKETREMDALFGKALAGNKTTAKPAASPKQAEGGAKDYGFQAQGDGDPGITDEDIPF